MDRIAPSAQSKRTEKNMSQPFCHLELNTPNLEAAKSFYGTMFGWTFDDIHMGPGMIYSLFKPEVGPGGGIWSFPDMPTAWLAYIAVDEIHEATKKATDLGAKVVVPPQEVPGKGWFTVLTDPTGASVAIWQQTGPI
jgi:predicted enzyme related to lactoylglutathione lyase